MIMFKPSSKQHCTTNSRKVVLSYKGLDRSELLCRATQFGDPTQLVNVVRRYALSSSFTTRITHLEGE